MLAVTLVAASMLGTAGAAVNAEGGDSNRAAARRNEQTLVDPGVTRLVGSRTVGDPLTHGARYSWNLPLKGADQ